MHQLEKNENCLDAKEVNLSSKNSNVFKSQYLIFYTSRQFQTLGTDTSFRDVYGHKIRCLRTPGAKIRKIFTNRIALTPPPPRYLLLLAKFT